MRFLQLSVVCVLLIDVTLVTSIVISTANGRKEKEGKVVSVDALDGGTTINVWYVRNTVRQTTDWTSQIRGKLHRYWVCCNEINISL